MAVDNNGGENNDKWLLIFDVGKKFNEISVPQPTLLKSLLKMRHSRKSVGFPNLIKQTHKLIEVKSNMPAVSCVWSFI